MFHMFQHVSFLLLGKETAQYDIKVISNGNLAGIIWGDLSVEVSEERPPERPRRALQKTMSGHVQTAISS